LVLADADKLGPPAHFYESDEAEDAVVYRDPKKPPYIPNYAEGRR
jgi:hypothetical protein